MDYFIDRRELSRIMAVSIASVDRMVKHGANGRPPLPARKIGSSVRIKVADFEAWIASQPTPVKPVRGRPRGSTKAAMARRRAQSDSEMVMPAP